MNILVIGSDNCGKTTLCENLTKYLNEFRPTEFVHSPGPKTLQEMRFWCENELLDKDSKFIKIFDRFSIIEEEVYGKILRGHSKFDELGEEYKDFILSKFDLIIFCYPGLFQCLNWGDREQMDGVKENAIDLINAYNTLIYQLIKKGYPVKEYNFKCDDYKDLVKLDDGQIKLDI